MKKKLFCIFIMGIFILSSFGAVAVSNEKEPLNTEEE